MFKDECLQKPINIEITVLELFQAFKIHIQMEKENTRTLINSASRSSLSSLFLKTVLLTAFTVSPTSENHFIIRVEYYVFYVYWDCSVFTFFETCISVFWKRCDISFLNLQPCIVYIGKRCVVICQTCTWWILEVNMQPSRPLFSYSVSHSLFYGRPQMLVNWLNVTLTTVNLQRNQLFYRRMLTISCWTTWVHEN